MSLGVRLKQARLKKNLTQEELAEVVGIKQQAVQRIEAGKVKSTSYIVQLARALDVTPEWLALGEEHPASHSEKLTDNNSSAHHSFAPLLQWQDVDLLAQLPAAPNNYLKLPVFDSANHKYFALQIKDNSMVAADSSETNFSKNDYIIVDTSVTPKSGDYVVAKLADSKQMTFRRWVTIPQGSQLQALNSQYNPIMVTRDTHICGKVVLRYSDFKH